MTVQFRKTVLLGGIVCLIMGLFFTARAQTTEEETAPKQEQVSDDEFEPFDETQSSEDEFSEFSTETASGCEAGCTGCKTGKDNSQLWWVLTALSASLVAGIMVRYRKTRNFRGFFLLASLLILGFYKGGCPCPIMSLHHVILALLGQPANWPGMVWFLGLIPITYLFGKVWCGWVCHLGALQEFLYKPGKIKIFQSEQAQKAMRIIRIVLLISLIVQLILTRSNLFKTIDPFKVAFNLQAGNLAGWILLGLLLATSLFIYRPFCKTVCPIGLILGWISKIPGASVLAPQKSCVGCKVCENSCKINAITFDGNISKLDNQECIACGDCTNDCKKGSMLFVRNSKQFGSKSVCKRS